MQGRMILWKTSFKCKEPPDPLNFILVADKPPMIYTFICLKNIYRVSSLCQTLFVVLGGNALTMTAVKVSSLLELIFCCRSQYTEQTNPQKARQHVRWWKVPYRKQSSKIMSGEGVHFSMGWPGRTSLQGAFEWELEEVRKKTLWISGETLPGR